MQLSVPHHVSMAADGVVEESGVIWLWKYSLGSFLIARPARLGAVALEVVVPLLQNKRNPAKLVFDEDNFSLGERRARRNRSVRRGY